MAPAEVPAEHPGRGREQLEAVAAVPARGEAAAAPQARGGREERQGGLRPGVLGGELAAQVALELAVALLHQAAVVAAGLAQLPQQPVDPGERLAVALATLLPAVRRLGLLQVPALEPRAEQQLLDLGGAPRQGGGARVERPLEQLDGLLGGRLLLLLLLLGTLVVVVARTGNGLLAAVLGAAALVGIDRPASYVRRQRAHRRGALDRGDAAVRPAGYVVGRERRRLHVQRLRAKRLKR